MPGPMAGGVLVVPARGAKLALDCEALFVWSYAGIWRTLGLPDNGWLWLERAGEASLAVDAALGVEPRMERLLLECAPGLDDMGTATGCEPARSS